MAYLGLVPSEDSTGDHQQQGSILRADKGSVPGLRNQTRGNTEKANQERTNDRAAVFDSDLGTASNHRRPTRDGVSGRSPGTECRAITPDTESALRAPMNQ
jgi:hypothetical protein